MKPGLNKLDVDDGGVDAHAQRGAHSVLDMLLAEVDRADADESGALTSIPRFAEGAQFLLELLNGKNSSNLNVDSTEDVERVVEECREIVDLLLVLKKTFSAERLQLFLMLSDDHTDEIQVRIHDRLFIVIEWQKTWFNVFSTDNIYDDPEDGTQAGHRRTVTSPHGRRKRSALWWKTALKDVELLLTEIAARFEGAP